MSDRSLSAAWRWLCGVALIVALPHVTSAQNGYAWKSVNISGAGAMVTNVLAHPLLNGAIYIRTDVGGCYRWDSANSKWIPMNDSLTFDQRFYYCCESLAIDPNNVSVLYYAGGFQTTYGNGALFKTTDRGTTWTKLSLAKPMGGNQDRRWAGERLAVAKDNSNVVLFGTRTDGLWRSTDAGGTWAKVAGIPTPADTYGVQSVAFDWTTPGQVYCAVSGSGVYRSTDDGATWTSIGGSTAPMRLQVGPDGVLWYTTRTGVSKYNGTAWTDYSPGGTDVYMALAINSSNGADVLVSRGESGGVYHIYRTTNAGASWTEPAKTLSSTATWNTPTRLRPCGMTFDPFNTATVWANQWRTTNINAATVAWVQQEANHEQDVTGAAIAPPSGYELLVGVFDDDGFAMNNGLDNYPTKQLGIVSSWNGHTWNMAYEYSSPLNMIRVGGQPFYGGVITVAKTSDGGANWSRMTFPSQLFPLSCAMSATNANNMFVVCNRNYSTDGTGSNWWPATATNPYRYTADGGATWGITTGLPSLAPAPYGPWFHNVFLAADTVNGSKFYYADPSGQIYRSTDGAATFAQVNTGTGQLLPAKDWMQLKVRPGVEGDLWECVDNDTTDHLANSRTPDEGLYHSANGGATWTKISSLSRCWMFGFGKAPAGTTTPVLYAYGRLKGSTVDSIYRSLDLGATWIGIGASNNNLSDTPYILEGSQQTFGRAFVGTGGRGFFYGSCGQPYSGTPMPMPGTIQAENFDTGGEGVGYHDSDATNVNGQYRPSEAVDIEACTDTGGGYDVTGIVAGEWMKYTINLNNAGTYTASFRVASTATGKTLRLLDETGRDLTGTVTVPNTGGSQTWQTVTATVMLTNGVHVLTLSTDTGGFNLNSLSLTMVNAAYLAGAYAIPGQINVKNYDKGGEGVAYHDTTSNNNGGQYRLSEGVDLETCLDTGGGYDLSYTAAGEWLKFTVNAQAAGIYNVSFRVASANTGASFHLEDNAGNNLTGSVVVPNTGAWQAWGNVSASCSLPAGVQTIKLVEETAGFNFNYMTFTAAGTAYVGPAAAIPGVIQAENYDEGGEGVGYHDSDTTNTPGQLRADGVDIERCLDTDGGFDINGAVAGEWLKYTVNVTTAGTYTVTFRVAAAASGGSLHIEDKNGVNLTGAVAIPGSGGSQVWSNVTKTITLPAGQQVLKVVVDGGGYNFSSMTFN